MSMASHNKPRDHPTKMPRDSPPAPTTTSNSTAAQQPCHFFKPPAEIRVRIYEFALAPDTDEDPIKDGKVEHDGDCSKFSCVTRGNWRTRSALLQVCQDIRNDATPIFYNSSTFHFRVNKTNYNTSVEWLDDIGSEQTRLISRLLISWEPTDRMLKKFTAATSKYDEDRAAQLRSCALQTSVSYNYHYTARLLQSSLQCSWESFSQLLDLQSNETYINKSVADAFGRELLASRVQLDAVLLDEPPITSYRDDGSFLGVGHCAFMQSLKWTLHPHIFLGEASGSDQS